MSKPTRILSKRLERRLYEMAGLSPSDKPPHLTKRLEQRIREMAYPNGGPTWHPTSRRILPKRLEKAIYRMAAGG